VNFERAGEKAGLASVGGVNFSKARRWVVVLFGPATIKDVVRLHCKRCLRR
jgi:hypothetical protein